VELEDAFKALPEINKANEGDQATSGTQSQQSVHKWQMYIVYEDEDESNVFRPDRLNHIMALEQELMSTESYKRLCLVDSVATSSALSLMTQTVKSPLPCSVALSIVPLFYVDSETVQGLVCQFFANSSLCSLNSTSPQTSASQEEYAAGGMYTELENGAAGQTRISLTLDSLADEEFYNSFSSFFFDKDFTKTNLESSVTRSVFLFGLPLAGYSGVSDDFDEQYDQVRHWSLCNIPVYPCLPRIYPS
jgi:hypothetical protein